MVDISKLSRIVRVGEKVRKQLELLNNLKGLISFIERMLVCDPFEDYCPYQHKLIDRIEKWMEYHELLEDIIKGKADKTYVITHWFIEPRINYADMELIEICLKDQWDCIQVFRKLPLSDEDIEFIKKKVKAKIEDLVEAAPFSLGDLLIGLKEILPALGREIDNLKEQYHKLEKTLKEVMGVGL